MRGFKRVSLLWASSINNCTSSGKVPVQRWHQNHVGMDIIYYKFCSHSEQYPAALLDVTRGDDNGSGFDCSPGFSPSAGISFPLPLSLCESQSSDALFSVATRLGSCYWFGSTQLSRAQQGLRCFDLQEIKRRINVHLWMLTIKFKVLHNKAVFFFFGILTIYCAFKR